MSSKRTGTVRHAKINPKSHKVEPTGDKGPEKTTPKHGKKNRWSYDAKSPQRKMK